VNCTIIDWCEVTAIIFDTFMGACFTVLLAGLVAAGVFFFYRQPKYRRQRETLEKLANLRTDGVKLRNMRPPKMLLRSINPNGLNAWLRIWDEAAEKWKNEVYKYADKFSLVEGQRLRTLDWMTTQRNLLADGLVVSWRQFFLLLEISETIERLNKVLEKRFRPQDAP